MKRRTRLILIGCAAMSGTFVFAGPASAHPTEPVAHPARPVVVKTSDPPPRVVHAPVGRVTVRPGDTLTAIGARTARSWEQLAGFNHLPNPNLILVDQVLTIPPLSYKPVAPPVINATAIPVSVHTVTSPTPYTAPHYAVSQPRSVSGGGSGVWGCIASHESGGNASINTGNGYYGAFQDTLGSWRAAGGGPGLPSDYSYSEQLAVNQRIQQQQGWRAWPVTSRMCGA